MKYFIRGKKHVELNQSDFITEGGEGKIYGKNGLIYKIYLDPTKMIPHSKIMELSVLDKNNIIVPKDIILDNKNKEVGFTMTMVNGLPLCKLFTNDFRDKNNIDNDNIIEIVNKMVEIINFVHEKKCLIVDGNEMNYLVDNSFTLPYLIDVNSLQTPSFPATAIMQSIRDFNSSKFTELTDWFSFAIVSFQLFVGIHPFKGKHPDYKMNQLEDRMRKNVSVFNKNTKVPSSCRDFSNIPTNFRNWYEDLFEKGKRTFPPILGKSDVIIQTIAKIINKTNSFDIGFFKDFLNDIVKVKNYNGFQCVTTKDKLWIDNSDYNISSPKVDVIFTPKMMKPLLVKIDEGKLILYDLKNKTSICTGINCTDKLVVGNSVYVKNDDNLTELKIIENGKITPAVKTVWKVMPKSSIILDGFIYQSVLGRGYLVIPKSETDAMQTVVIKELDGCRVIDGKYKNGICFIIYEKNGIYNKLMIKIDKTGRYKCELIENIHEMSINFTVLDNGLVIAIPEDGVVELFTNNMDNNQKTVINDTDIKLSMNLFNNGVKAMFYNGKETHTITMRK